MNLKCIVCLLKADILINGNSLCEKHYQASDWFSGVLGMNSKTVSTMIYETWGENKTNIDDLPKITLQYD